MCCLGAALAAGSARASRGRAGCPCTALPSALGEGCSAAPPPRQRQVWGKVGPFYLGVAFEVRTWR